MKRIITYGSFDLFHVGHVRLLRRLKAVGDYLYVACSTDEFNQAKGKRSIMPFEQRVEVLEACRYVDKVIPESAWDQKLTDVERYKIDVFAMGDDWAGEFDFLSKYVEVLYLPRTEDVSTTDVRQLAASLNSEVVEEARHAIEHAIRAINRL